MSEAHDHDHDHGEMAIDPETQTQVFLELRRQNVEMLKIAAQVAGYAGNHAPLKPDEVRAAKERIWDLYAEFYEWIDPEESEEE
jgi:hypothetical protein